LVARLLALSKATGQTFDLVLTRFALERLLYRLSKSQYAYPRAKLHSSVADRVDRRGLNERRLSAINATSTGCPASAAPVSPVGYPVESDVPITYHNMITSREIPSIM
jgi:hypothetical protein